MKLHRFVDLQFSDSQQNRPVYAPRKDLFDSLLPYLKVDCVFDVGANNGQYAQILRKHADYQGRIISFEPIPSAADPLPKK